MLLDALRNILSFLALVLIAVTSKRVKSSMPGTYRLVIDFFKVKELFLDVRLVVVLNSSLTM